MLHSFYPHACSIHEPRTPESLNGYLFLYIPYYPDHVKLDFVFSKKFKPSRPPTMLPRPLPGKELGTQKYCNGSNPSALHVDAVNC